MADLVRCLFYTTDFFPGLTFLTYFENFFHSRTIHFYLPPKVLIQQYCQLGVCVVKKNCKPGFFVPSIKIKKMEASVGHGHVFTLAPGRVEYLKAILENRKKLFEGQSSVWKSYDWYKDSIQLASIIAFYDLAGEKLPPLESPVWSNVVLRVILTPENTGFFVCSDESVELVICDANSPNGIQLKVSTQSRTFPSVYLMVHMDMRFNENWMNETLCSFRIIGFIHSSVVLRNENIEEIENSFSGKINHYYVVDGTWCREWEQLYRMDYDQRVKLQ
jgi:hypothetical protein